jgi:deoxyxylulose-5-phosphate synthase
MPQDWMPRSDTSVFADGISSEIKSLCQFERSRIYAASFDRVLILALGTLVPNGQELALRLESEGISAALVNARYAKPIDTEILEFYARRVEAIVTMEDHVLSGGFGSAVLGELNKLQITTLVVRIGWPDRFIEHGNLAALRANYGVSAEAALTRLRPYLGLRACAPEADPAVSAG